MPLKKLPLVKLHSDFLNEQLTGSIESILEAGGTVNAVVCDCNRNNRAYFRIPNADPLTPWLTRDVLLV